MKVVCTTPMADYLTRGKEYEVEATYGDRYVMTDDSGDVHLWFTTRFDNSTPSYKVSAIDTSMSKTDMHTAICNELNDTYRRKNADYGDSFTELRDRLPNAILYRTYDKYMRLETLLKGSQAQVKDESIEDTLLDMANYCIMEVIEMRRDKND